MTLSFDTLVCIDGRLTIISGVRLLLVIAETLYLKVYPLICSLFILGKEL